jgi:hypothetical protein
MRKGILAAAMLLTGAMSALGQMGQAPDGPPVGTVVEPSKAIDPLIGLWEMEFVGVAKAMPADKYDFKPASNVPPGAKFDGVRTFGEEVKHVTQANYYFYGAASGMKPEIDMKSISGAEDEGGDCGGARGFVRVRPQGDGDADDGELVQGDQGGGWDVDAVCPDGVRAGARVRPLWADGGIPADERNCAARQQIALRAVLGFALSSRWSAQAFCLRPTGAPREA